MTVSVHDCHSHDLSAIAISISLCFSWASAVGVANCFGLHAALPIEIFGSIFDVCRLMAI